MTKVKNTPDWGRLKPHLWGEWNDGTGEFDLMIFCKKDTADQKINLESIIKPTYPYGCRMIVFKADDKEHDQGDHNFYKKISVADKELFEDRIHVVIKHDHTEHGGSGTVHYPPPPDGD